MTALKGQEQTGHVRQAALAYKLLEIPEAGETASATLLLPTNTCWFLVKDTGDKQGSAVQCVKESKNQ